MKKLNYRALEPIGKCSHCGINCWAETEGKPAVWPCGLDQCPYPEVKHQTYERSSTGNSLTQIIYEGD